jgi:probable rRNA maturation factor
LTTVIILETAINGISRQTLARFATRARELAGVSGEVAVLITSSQQIQQLNRRFRGKNKPTDVLSFPREDGGDIAISAEIAQSNAQRFRHSTAAEIKVLILHGMLHLAGYDHEADNGRMQKREAKLRAQLRLPASLIQRSLNGPASSPAFAKNGPAAKTDFAKKAPAAKKTSRALAPKLKSGGKTVAHKPQTKAVAKGSRT